MTVVLFVVLMTGYGTSSQAIDMPSMAACERARSSLPPMRRMNEDKAYLSAYVWMHAYCLERTP